MNTSAPASPGIILVEDDQALQDSIAEYLSRVGYSVTAVGTGLDFFRAFGEQIFNAAIIDLGLPDIPGIRLVEYIHTNSDIPCIIQTAHDLLEERVQGYESGADLYLIKPVDCRELASALRQLLRRNYGRDAQASQNIHWYLSIQKSSLLAPNQALAQLSFKELIFMRCLAADLQQPALRQTLLEALHYADNESSHRALESLVRRLRRKIEQASGSNPIITCHGVGYSFSAPLIVE